MSRFLFCFNHDFLHACRFFIIETRQKKKHLDKGKVPPPRRRVDVRARSPARPPRALRQPEDRFRVAIAAIAAAGAFARECFLATGAVPD